jgi:hypothetical protein
MMLVLPREIKLPPSSSASVTRFGKSRYISKEAEGSIARPNQCCGAALLSRR